uniref:tRNA pseudouridine synthase A n=1 Tax=candidate division WOR-3 bacterium TaxID=2052148 RepID=A0A7V3NU16_UNCW3
MVIKGVVEYDGTDFFGWQIQKDRRTVQGVLKEALKTLFRDVDFRLIGASRTDAGVHAENQVFSVHFDSDLQLDLNQLKRSLNAILPQDVYVKSLEPAPDDFHARFSAKSKVYRYRILDGKRSPLRSRYVWELPYPLDEKILSQCAELIKGEIDFSFLEMVKEKEDKRVRFYNAYWRREEDEIVFYVEGSHFLYRLVRALVGSMVYSFKKFGNIEFFQNFLEGRERKVIVAPAKGLTLLEVKY